MIIDTETFKLKVGGPPGDDDLERVNCKDTGKFGHLLCGWCPLHDLPRFICGCLARRNEILYRKYSLSQPQSKP